MGKEENEVQASVLELMGIMPDVWAHRNNTGRRGRVTYGLGIGSSDIIGRTTITVTPEMVGTKVAVFTAVEIKAKGGKPTRDQIGFIDDLVSAGGIGFVADSVEAYIEQSGNLINKIRKGGLRHGRDFVS